MLLETCPDFKSNPRWFIADPADVTRCTVQANSGSWTINGSCDISKVFSSNNNYSCAWYRGNNQVNGNKKEFAKALSQ